AEAARSTSNVRVPAITRGPVGRQVRVPKTAELVARSLRRQIIRGELGQGEALPSESALMEQFGVSRPTLREAFRVLESESLIDAEDAFHTLGVGLTGNETLTLLTGMLRYMVDRSNASQVAAQGDSPDARAQARKGHRTHVKLVELIEAGKAEEAEQLWFRH